MTDQPVAEQGDIPEFHRLTGEAIRIWATINDTLMWFIMMLLAVDQFRARIVMQSIRGSRARRDFVQRLATTYLDPVLLPTLNKLMQRMSALGKTRNDLAHTPMHINVDGKENKVFGDKFSKIGLDFDFHDLPMDELQQCVQSLQDLHRDLIRFQIECDGKVHVKPRVHRDAVYPIPPQEPDSTS